MLRDVFNSIGGFESFGIFSMFIFVVFFTLLVRYTISLRKTDVEKFSQMPLDDVSNESDDNQDIK